MQWVQLARLHKEVNQLIPQAVQGRASNIWLENSFAGPTVGLKWRGCSIVHSPVRLIGVVLLLHLLHCPSQTAMP